MAEKIGNSALTGTERLEARRKAEERLAVIKQQNAKALEDYAKQRQVEVAKTARLRALRLAKEAAGKDAPTPAPAVVAAPPTRALRRKPRQPTTSSATNPKGPSPLRGQGDT